VLVASPGGQHTTKVSFQFAAVLCEISGDLPRRASGTALNGLH
jgi:hypothetical protein